MLKKFKPQNLVTALMVGVAVFFLMGTGGPTISSEQAKTLVKDGAFLLDVRTPGEFEGGHIPGAKNIPVQVLDAQLAALPQKKDQPIVVYCQSGRRSASAKTMLEKAGYTNVSDLGGISNWK